MAERSMPPLSRRIIRSHFQGVSNWRAELGVTFDREPQLVDILTSNTLNFSPALRKRLGLGSGLQIDAKVRGQEWQIPDIPLHTAYVPEINTVFINPFLPEEEREVQEIWAATLPFVHAINPGIYKRRKDFFNGKVLDQQTLELIDTEQIIVAGLAEYALSEFYANKTKVHPEDKDESHSEFVNSRSLALKIRGIRQGLSREDAQIEARYHPLIRGHELVFFTVEYLMREKGFNYDASFRFLVENTDLIGPYIDKGETFAAFTLEQIKDRQDFNAQLGF